MPVTAAELLAFQQDGYVVLDARVPAPLLDRLRGLFERLMRADDSADRVENQVNGRRYVTNLDRVMSKGNLACLELLGSPWLLDIAASICGPDFFLIQEFGVIKELGDTSRVLWHQDMLHGRTGPCFTMGIYLDDADADDGALRVVPRSHLMTQDICALQHLPSVDVPVSAGGLLIHDMMLAHSSERLTKNPIRRVLYFEFLSVQHVLRERIYDAPLLQNRLRCLQHAIAHYASLYGTETSYPWASPLPLSPDVAAQSLGETCAGTVHARPSAYCFEQVQRSHTSFDTERDLKGAAAI
jgi:Phytanoyl-CoA dioxygenase (PhyH)